jgi:hypothetical protein
MIPSYLRRAFAILFPFYPSKKKLLLLTRSRRAKHRNFGFSVIRRSKMEIPLSASLGKRSCAILIAISQIMVTALSWLLDESCPNTAPLGKSFKELLTSSLFNSLSTNDVRVKSSLNILSTPKADFWSLIWWRTISSSLDLLTSFNIAFCRRGLDNANSCATGKD